MIFYKNSQKTKFILSSINKIDLKNNDWLKKIFKLLIKS